MWSILCASFLLVVHVSCLCTDNNIVVYVWLKFTLVVRSVFDRNITAEITSAMFSKSRVLLRSAAPEPINRALSS